MGSDTYSFNLYNGVIMSNSETTTYKGILNPRETYTTHTYYDYDLERKYCTILTKEVSEITISAAPTEFTNGTVKVMVQYPKSENGKRQFSEDGSTWQDVSNDIYMGYITENKTIYARTLNESDILLETKQKEISNIDKITPISTIKTDKNTIKVAIVEDKVSIKFSISASDEGVSGLKDKQYAWIKGEDTPTQYTDIENETEITKDNLGIGKYYLWLKVSDNAGNISELTKMRFSVEFQEPVAQIGDIKYTTVQEAIDACSKTAEDTKTTIILLKDTDEESTIYEGQNIIFDLQGHILGSSNQNRAVLTNAGIIKITDTSEAKKGKIESLTGTAITNTGTLVLGEETNNIDNETPTIYGKNKGIENTGELNYYDGTITAKAPIIGNINKTPESYGPIGAYENNMTTVKLGIVSDYVARIEWVYYSKLQIAIDNCKSKSNNTDVTEIIILKDIILNETAKTYYGQNISLNLNSHVITANEVNCVIENIGILHIGDNSNNKDGEIKIRSKNDTYSIRNIKSGVVILEEGKINSSSAESRGYGIYNKEEGRVKILGGTITSDGRDNTVIYNESNGIIEILGGTISSKNINSTANCIYNTGNGKVKMTGGLVNVISRGGSN